MTCDRKIVRCWIMKNYEWICLEFGNRSHALVQVWPISLNGNNDDDDAVGGAKCESNLLILKWILLLNPNFANDSFQLAPSVYHSRDCSVPYKAYQNMTSVSLTTFNEENCRIFDFARFVFLVLKSIQLRIRFYRNSCLKRPIHSALYFYTYTRHILNLAYFTFFYSSPFFPSPCMLVFYQPNAHKKKKMKKKWEKDQNYAHNSDCKWNRNRLNLCTLLCTECCVFSNVCKFYLNA